MDSRVTHPTKEQVRAYMMAREHEHRPPPSPEEIRRQLGWRLAPPEPPCAFLGMCLLPATLGQLAAQAALGWMLAPLRAQLGMNSLPGETLPH
jgi:hypothetical protein